MATTYLVRLAKRQADMRRELMKLQFKTRFPQTPPPKESWLERKRRERRLKLGLSPEGNGEEETLTRLGLLRKPLNLRQLLGQPTLRPAGQRLPPKPIIGAVSERVTAPFQIPPLKPPSGELKPAPKVAKKATPSDLPGESKLWLDKRSRQKAIDAGKDFYYSTIRGEEVSVKGFPITRPVPTFEFPSLTGGEAERIVIATGQPYKGEMETVNPDTGRFPSDEGKPAGGVSSEARFRERAAQSSNPIVRFANTPTKLFGLTPGDIVGIGLIVQGGISAIRSFTEFSRLPQYKTMTRFAQRQATKGQPIPQNVQQEAKNALKTAFNLHKMGAKEAAEDIMAQFNKAYAGTAQAATQTKAEGIITRRIPAAGTRAIAPFKPTLAPKFTPGGTAIPGQTKSLAEIMVGAEMKLGAPAKTLSKLATPEETQTLKSVQALASKAGFDLEAVQGIAPNEYWVSLTRTTKPEARDLRIGWLQKLDKTAMSNQHLGILSDIAEVVKGRVVGRFYPFKTLADAQRFLTSGDTSGITTSIRLRGQPWTPEQLAETRRVLAEQDAREAPITSQIRALNEKLVAAWAELSNRPKDMPLKQWSALGNKLDKEIDSLRKQITEIGMQRLQPTRVPLATQVKVTPAPEIAEKPPLVAQPSPIWDKQSTTTRVKIIQSVPEEERVKVGLTAADANLPWKSISQRKRTAIITKRIPKAEVTPVPEVRKPTAIEIRDWRAMGFTDEDISSLSKMSSELRELHTHQARITGFRQVSDEIIDDYLQKALTLAKEVKDTKAIKSIEDAIKFLKKGDLQDALFESEKGLGYIHQSSGERLEHIAEMGRLQPVIRTIDDVLRFPESAKLALPKAEPVPEAPAQPAVTAKPQAAKVPPVEKVARLAEQVKAKLAAEPPAVKPPISKTPVARRAEIQSLLLEPAKNLPKGTTKIALRKELADINRSLIPQEKKLRQQIMASVRAKFLPEKQYRDIFREIGGSRQLSTIGLPKLESILSAIQKARPKKIAGKTVITPSTEKAIQSLRAELIKQGDISEKSYEAIKKFLRLKTDKFETPQRFISEREGKELIRTMNFEAEVGLLKKETEIAKALEDKPELKAAIDKISARTDKETVSYVNKGVKVSPLWDMWVYNEKLQNRTGKPFYDLYRSMLDKRLANISKAEDIFKELAESTPEFGKIASDKQALDRVNSYVASKLGEKGEISKEMTAGEITLAEAIEKALFSFRNSVRYNRFTTTYYQHEGDIAKMAADIPNAPREDLREAIRIYETSGAKALSDYLNTKDWGVIKTGYEPHIVVNPKLQLRRIKATILPKGMLKTREGITFDHGEKDILQRTHTYVHRMFNLELEPYFKKLDMLLKEANLREPGATANDLSLMIDEMKGTFYIDEPLARIIAKAGGYATSVVYLSPHLGFRNLFQNLAMYPDKTALVNPLNAKLGEDALAYFETYVNQGRQFTQQFLLQRELGSGRLANFLRRISFMGVSESVNNHWAFWAGTNKAARALATYKETGDITHFMESSGLTDLTLRQQKEVLELLAVSKENEAIWLIARKINQNTNMIYDRAQGAPVTMGTSGRLLGSLLNFTRGYGQRVGQQLGKLTPGHTPSEMKHSVKILLGLALFGIAVGALYTKITGKKQNPYNPLLMITWSPGGLAVGAMADTADVIGTIMQAISGDEDSLMRLPSELARSGDLLIPFYSVLLNALESLTDTKYVDRLALRKVIALVRENYKPDEKFYEKERSWIGKFQHALFGGEPKTREEKVKEELESKWTEDVKAYNDIPSDVDEVRANRKQYPLTRAQYRVKYPDVDAKLFILGEVTSLSGAARDIAVKLMRENKLTVDDVPGLVLGEFPSQAEKDKRRWFEIALGGKTTAPSPVAPKPAPRQTLPARTPAPVTPAVLGETWLERKRRERELK